MTNYEARFDGIKRLYGAAGQQRLCDSHVCIIGIGGVGSWAVEALARSGVGKLTLVDLDDVCISNVNRQTHAVTGEFGKPKISVMAQRVKLINPDCVIHECQRLFTASTAGEILAIKFDALLDAIDSPSMKALMIAECVRRGIPVITTGGAGGRRDPTALRCCDLAHSTHDRLLAVTRKLLRTNHGFPKVPGTSFGVHCVFSPEAQVFPANDGTVCEKREADSSLRLDCRSGYGTASFVTGAFGFAAAAEAVRIIVESHRQTT